jgi:hypothetical protein
LYPDSLWRSKKSAGPARDGAGSCIEGGTITRGVGLIGLKLIREMWCMTAVFMANTKAEKAVCWLFGSCIALTAISFTLYSIFYGIYREYRFEIAAISINWLTLVTTGMLLSVVFRRALVAATAKQHDLFPRVYRHGFDS